jgi:hypothetical protein
MEFFFIGSTIVLRSTLYARFESYYFCVGLMLLGKFHRRCLAVNHGCSAFCSHQRRATDFVVGRCIRGRNPSKLSAQYGNCVLPRQSVYEWILKLKNSSASVMNFDLGRIITDEETWFHHCEQESMKWGHPL